MPMPYYQVSRDASVAQTEFSTELFGALAAVESPPWAMQFGLTHTGKFKTIWPIPVSQAQYRLREGDDRYRSLYSRSLSMVPDKYQDGIEEVAEVLEGPDFIGWAGEPGRIAMRTREHPNKLVAAVLVSSANLEFYRSEEDGLASAIPLFSAVHLVNVFDTSLSTFSNISTATTINAAFQKELNQVFATRKAPDGSDMNLTVTDLIVPPALKEEAKDFYESDSLLTALSQDADAAAPLGFTNNRHKNAVNLIVAPEISAGAGGSDSIVYAIDRNGPAPWIIQSTEAPEEFRFDKTSEYYGRTGKVAINYVHTAGAKACLPHAIQQITIG